MHPQPQPSGSPHSIRKTVGIDLGTTNSVIALLDPADSALVTGRDEQGRMTFPSLVGFDPRLGRLVAGRAALALPGADKSVPGEFTLPLSSVKRYMGLERTFRVGPQSLTPSEASAVILRHLRDILSSTLADPRYRLDSAIVTMPAYFNHNQIEATREAGELAGFEVVELLHEPTAAAIYYSWRHGHGDSTYLVYDLGGGTFDVSIIRRRLGDHEVLSVSGDPFLGGDDFDRLLASHLLETGSWSWQTPSGREAFQGGALQAFFDPTTAEGAPPFARLVRVAEVIKCALTDSERVTREVPVLTVEGRGVLAVEVDVERSAFESLIKSKVNRTIDCCREALGRAKEKAGLALGDIDHVILVGGSSRVPLVRQTVEAAFCNPHLPESVRSPGILLHEPDLCVAYGAALRAGSHGTRYLFPLVGAGLSGELELHLTSPACTSENPYHATGVVRYHAEKAAAQEGPALDGASVRIQSRATGLVDEVFLDQRGTFGRDVELEPGTDNAIDWVVCDAGGRDLSRITTVVRHRSASQPLDQAVLPTQIITKPLAIEVLTRGRQRIKQVVAPIGATLPATFRCSCRTADQSGRIVLPIYEENRLVKQLVIEGLPPSLPVGASVEVEFALDVKHSIAVTVLVRQGEGEPDRVERAWIEAPPPPGRPTLDEVEEVQKQIDALLVLYVGAFRSRMKARAAEVRQDLLEALRYDDEPRAIQRMAELRALAQLLEVSQGQVLDPPWPRFAQLVRDGLDLASRVAERTGRDRDELFQHIHAQERYAEQAYEEHNQALYKECWENLRKYAGYLSQLLEDSLPRPPSRPNLSPEEEAREAVDRFRAFLSGVWKRVRGRQRTDLEPRLAEIARQASGLSQRLKEEPQSALREARRLGTEVAKVEDQLEGRRPAGPPEEAGLLEGEG